MPVDIEHSKQQLLAKREELVGDIARFEEQARESRSAEVEDPIDQVTSTELKAGGFQVSTIAARTLRDVEDALRRIDEGEYGTCIDCGRRIEPARLEAIPWARYCRDDQERHDRETTGDEDVIPTL